MATNSETANFFLIAGVILILMIIPIYLGGIGSIYFALSHLYGEQYGEAYAKLMVNPLSWWTYMKWMFVDFYLPYSTHPQLQDSDFQMKLFGPIFGSIFGMIVLLWMMRAPLLDFRPFSEKEEIHGSAKWASEADIKRAGLRSKKGFLLGRTGAKNYLVADDFQHALLFAPTGSGKGVGFVLPNLLFWEESVVCHDIKLENFLVTSGWRQSIGQSCYVWNPADPDGHTHCYNPLDWISTKPGQMVDDVQKICNLILPEQEFWMNEARSLLMGVILYLCADPNKPTSFGEVVRTMRSDDVVYSLAVVLDTIGKKIHPVSYMNIAAFLQKADKERSGVISTMNSGLELWANPLIDTSTASSDFNMMQLKREKLTVYCGVTPDNLQRLEPLLKVFYQQAADFLTRNMPTAEEPYGVLFVMDEFPTLGEMQAFQSGIAYFRGYRVKLFLIAQDTQQLKGIYEEAGMNSFLSNSYYRVTFAANNIDTANMISQLIGNKTVKQYSHNKPKFLDLNPGSRTMNESEIQRALLLPQEVITLPRDQQILLIESFPPIRTQKIFYFEDPFFCKRAWGQNQFKQMTGPVPVDVPTQEPYDPRKKAEPAPEAEAPPADAASAPPSNDVPGGGSDVATT
ncbi:MAG: type IV secretory system conjugative DNA transfer family protein [Rickettsiales bacterium]|nr:type IV secretory system conjugative DNA transfer family protein [Rickettsiales bacterium]